MKVLQINSVCGIGSTGRIAADLQGIIEANGSEGIIAYGRGSSPGHIKSKKIGTNFDNYIHLANTRVFDRHGFSSQKATKEFITWLESYNPDIIHLHNIHGYYLNVELLFDYIKKHNKKVVWTLHDCWPFTGHCTYFDYAKCSKWIEGCSKCPQKGQYPSSLIMDNSERNYKDKKRLFTGVENMTIVTPSKWLRDRVSLSFLGKYNTQVINNGIDLGVFRPLESGIRSKYSLEGKFIVLGVANIWDERKGLKYFLELSQRLSEDFKIVLIGLTEKQIKELPANIIGISRTDTVEDLVKYYSMADVFVNPTLEDNFPTTNLEALACGTPVITFNTGGSPEAIDHKTGIVTKGKNTEALMEAIKEIKENGKRYYSQNCTDRARDNYDKNIALKKYIEIYQYS